MTDRLLLQLLWREDLSHAFCTSTQQCNAVACLVHGLVEPLLLECEGAGQGPPVEEGRQQAHKLAATSRL